MSSLKKKILLVSPAKSGTHLIVSILENLQLTYRGKLKICSSKEGYYSLSNTFHTSFKKYFYKLDKETYDGGKLLPINNFLGVVNCRHPADIFFSYLNYSFENNNTSYSNMNFKNKKELIKFVYENSFYEDFFKSLFEYTSWSNFNNFITISFESLRNVALEGDISENTKRTLSYLINVENIFELIKNSFGSSDTFLKGNIGEGIEFLKNNYPKIFEDKYYVKYCDFYGYEYSKVTEPLNLGSENKKIQIFDSRPKNIQITIEKNYHNHNIIYLNNKIYAIPFGVKHNDVIKNIKKFLSADDLDEIKFKILNSKKSSKNWIKKILGV